MNPWLIVGVLLAWGGSLAGTGWWFYGAGQDAQIAKTVETSELIRAAGDAAQQGAASAIAALKPRNTTIRQETEREVHTNTVYADCRLTDGVRRNIDEALTGRREPAGASQLPRAVASQ